MSPSLIGVCHAKLSISPPILTGIKNRLVVFVRRICGFIHNPNEKKQGSIRAKHTIKLYPYPWDKLIVHFGDPFSVSMLYDGRIKRCKVLK